MPQTPPPPYEAVGGWVEPPQQNTFYQQQYQSQLSVQSLPPKTLRKKQSAYQSSLELARSRVNQMRIQEQPRPAQNGDSSSPPNRGFNECAITRTMVQAAAGCDAIAQRFQDVLCRVDAGNQNENNVESLARDLSLDDTRYRKAAVVETQEQERSRGLLNVQKSWMYANSRLPPHMVPFRVYMPSWPVFCKAAEASVAVYKRPRRGEREDYVEANWRHGTKAMVLKTTPLDDQNFIVIAIRGSQWNIMDWCVNFALEPTRPIDFLDDEGNACHQGFLQVARSMVDPVAARLKQLLEQSPSRVASTLLFTGHSAGGAVANLLYLHMHSKTPNNALAPFNGVFKHVHCVTFGVPPMSLLPLQNPAGRQYDRNIFVSFVNEGDPIVRADVPYMKSLARLFAASTPKPISGKGLRSKASRLALKGQDSGLSPGSAPTWPVPEAALSNAGRLVLLREKPGNTAKVEATYLSDGQLRDVVFGDPVMHHIEVYQRRIFDLATAAVTGRDKG